MSADDIKPKYRVLGDRDGIGSYGFDPYHVAETLFGYDRVKSDDDHVWIVEGELDVIALSEIGIRAVATGKAGMSEAQLALFPMMVKCGLVVFDSDPAGMEATIKTVAQLVHKIETVGVATQHPGDALGQPDRDHRREWARRIEDEAVGGTYFLSLSREEQEATLYNANETLE